MAPLLVFQFLLDGQAYLYDSTISRVHVVYLNHHERSLRRPLMPDVIGLPALGQRQYFDNAGRS